jgi:DnaJ domain
MVASYPIVRNGAPKRTNDFTYPSDEVSYYDPYHILHIRRDATNYEMKRSYQQLAILYHPNLSMTSSRVPPEMASSVQRQKHFAFSLISASYETLSNMETRQRMDTLLLQQRPQYSANTNMDRCPKCRMIMVSKDEQKMRKLIQEERLLQLQKQKDKKTLTKKKKLPPLVEGSPRLPSNTTIKDDPHNPVVQDIPKINSVNVQDMICHDVESSTITTDRIILHKRVPNPDVEARSKAKTSSLENRKQRERFRRRGCDWNSCASSACYTSSFQDDHPASIHSKHPRKTPVPPLLLSSDSDDSDSASESSCARNHLAHHSTNDTERWFGGPLKLMYRARRFQPFTDPFVLFDRVFHSRLLPSQWHTSSLALLPSKRISQVEPCLPLIAIGSTLAPLSPANDTTETLRDGITITKAQRFQRPYAVTTSDPAQAMVKLILRTVTRYPPDPFSGKRRTVIQVTSDYVAPIEQNGPSFHGSKADLMMACTGWMPCKSASYEDDDSPFASFCRSWFSFC